jgi:hypothetical protein
VVATVLNIEAISVIHTHIFDAGFDDLDIIPLGADKVFICSLLAEAKDFFNLFFSNHV